MVADHVHLTSPGIIPGNMKAEQALGTLASTGVLFKGTAIFNVLLIIATFGGETIFRRFSFSCPCAYPQNMMYSRAFMYTPSIALFIFGIILNGNTWRLLHGCWFRTKRTRHACLPSSYFGFSVIAQALVAPTAWLFIVFLDGSYYECLYAPEFCLAKQYPNGTSTIQFPPDVQASVQAQYIKEHLSMNEKIDPNCICKLPEMVSKHLRAESQVYAWIMLLCGCLVIITVFCWVRCFDRYTYIQNMYVHRYRDIEATLFETKCQEHMEKLAVENCKEFFKKKPQTKLDWDKISMVPLSDYPYVFSDEKLAKQTDFYLTPLDEWHKEHSRAMGKWHRTWSRLDIKDVKANSLPMIDETDSSLLMHTNDNRHAHSLDEEDFHVEVKTSTPKFMKDKNED